MARKTMFDDGFFNFLVEGARFVGTSGIPMLMDIPNDKIPNSLWPFERRNLTTNYRQYIHFYMHDKGFAPILHSPDRYLPKLQLYDGMLTPDFTLTVGQSRCLQEANTYMNRAVGFYFQRHGVPVIPSIRWSDKTSFDFCFLGVPKNRMVSISTHGCIKSMEQKLLFKEGLDAMLNELQPPIVLVHGYMPDVIFGEFLHQVCFHRYPSRIEETRGKGGTNGNI